MSDLEVKDELQNPRGRIVPLNKILFGQDQDRYMEMGWPYTEAEQCQRREKFWRI